MQLDFGTEDGFRKVLEIATGYAKFPWPVLIEGETGVGKELLAQHIHHLSPRRHHPFIPLNCSTIPGTLFESELFGHEKGAFSGANGFSKGLVRHGQGGTIFLDEIGELDLGLQAKLLRLLESGEIRAVGSSRIECINVRFIAATNIRLHHAVKRGQFRHDLLQRLSVLTLHVPPLRERKSVIPQLAAQLLRGMNLPFDPHALAPLTLYDWPGNIRQLKNVLIRAAVQGEGRVESKVLRPLLEEEQSQIELMEPEQKGYFQGTLAEIERQVIVETLKLCHGNRKKAARKLGIAKSTLHEKIRRWQEASTNALPWPLSRVVYSQSGNLGPGPSHSQDLDF